MKRRVAASLSLLFVVGVLLVPTLHRAHCAARHDSHDAGQCPICQIASTPVVATAPHIEPDVLLLDEPTAGLDPLTSTHLIEMLATAAGSGKTIITATHDLHIIEDIADKVYVFGQDRRMAGHGSPADVLANTPLLRANNLIHRHSHHARDHRAMKTG